MAINLSKMLEAAQALDKRRRRQIENQHASITHLLVLNSVGPDPEAAAQEITRLNGELARHQEYVSRIQREVNNLTLRWEGRAVDGTQAGMSVRNIVNRGLHPTMLPATAGEEKENIRG